MAIVHLTKTFGDVTITARPEDSYVDATALCKLANKKWNNYYVNKRTTAFLAALESETGIPVTALVQSSKGGSAGGCTWIHPLVMVNFIAWASPKFEVQVTKWAFELMTTGRVELDAKPELIRELEMVRGELVQVSDRLDRVQASTADALQDAVRQLLAKQGHGPRLEGPFWTVAGWLEEHMPEWNTTSKQRHAIGQDAKRRVERACPTEHVGYYNRDLAFQAHQAFYLEKAARAEYRKACKAGKADTYGLFSNPVTVATAS